MQLFNRFPFVLVILLLGFLASDVNGLSAKYCSSQNTGADYSAVSNKYQSNGACFTNCKSAYAFAVVQGTDCWCSNYIPAETTSTEDCNEVCPGYGQESCGSSSNGLFGYVALSLDPSGTAGDSSSVSTTMSSSQESSSSQAVSGSSSFAVRVSSSTSSLPPSSFTSIFFPSTAFITTSGSSELFASPSTRSNLTPLVQSSTASPSPVTVYNTVTASPSVQVSTISVTSSSTPQPTTFQTSTTSYTSSSPITTETPTSSWSPTPITVRTTVTGKVQFVTITPTAPPDAAHQSSSSWPMGKKVGIAVGVVVAVLAIGCLAAYLLYRHRRQVPPAAVYKDDDESPQRHPSRTSQMSLMGTRSSALQNKPLPQIQTSGLDGIPFMNGRSPEMSSPSSKRASYPRLHDQRLDPNVLWANQDNGSRVSVRSLQDDHDYSRRVLRLANPDD